MLNTLLRLGRERGLGIGCWGSSCRWRLRLLTVCGHLSNHTESAWSTLDSYDMCGSTSHGLFASGKYNWVTYCLTFCGLISEHLNRYIFVSFLLQPTSLEVSVDHKESNPSKYLFIFVNIVPYVCLHIACSALYVCLCVCGSVSVHVCVFVLV